MRSPRGEAADAIPGHPRGSRPHARDFPSALSGKRSKARPLDLAHGSSASAVASSRLAHDRVGGVQLQVLQRGHATAPAGFRQTTCAPVRRGQALQASHSRGRRSSRRSSCRSPRSRCPRPGSDVESQAEGHHNLPDAVFLPTLTPAAAAAATLLWIWLLHPEVGR